MTPILRGSLFMILMAASANAQTLPKWETSREVVVDGVASELNWDVRWVVVNPAGTIFVSQANARNIHVFGADGKRITVFGREGSGPGDFGWLWSAGMLGDSIWVYDYNLRRVTVITPDAKLGRIQKIEPVKTPKNFRLPISKVAGSSFHSLQPDGRILASVVSSEGIHGMSRELPGAPLLRVTANGDAEAMIGWRPTVREAVRPDKGMSLTQEFPNMPMFGIAPNGSWLATVVATLADSLGTAIVTAFRPNGDTAYSRSLILALRPIPDSIVDQRYAYWERELLQGKDGRERVAAFRSLPRPRYYPPLESVTVSNSGQVLIGFVADGPEREYIIVGAEGRPLATLRLPARAKPMQFDGAVIWTSEPNSDLVPTIVRRRVLRDGGAH